MENLERITELLRYVCRHVVHQMEVELQRFATALEAWVNELLAHPLQNDWRQRMHAYLDGWEPNGFGVAMRAPADPGKLDRSLAKARGPLPETRTLVAERAGHRQPDTRVRDGGSILDPDVGGERSAALGAWGRAEGLDLATRHPRSFASRKSKVRIVSRQTRSPPGNTIPTILPESLSRWLGSFFPDSEPTTVINYADGTREIFLSGGPNSRALAAQATAIAGIVGQSIAGERLATELVETVVDTGVQEATGSPVGPSILRSRSRRKPSWWRRISTNPELVQDIAARTEAKINKPGSVPGIHKHMYAKKLLDRYQSVYGDRAVRIDVW